MKLGPFIAVALCCLSAIVGIYRGLLWMEEATQPVASALSSQPVPTRDATVRIGVVDLQRLLDAHPQTELEKAEINSKRAEARDELQRLIDQGDRAAATQFRLTREKELQIESVRLRQEIVADLQAHIAIAVRKHGLTILLDSSGKSMNGAPVVFHSSRVTDITDDVLRDLKP